MPNLCPQCQKEVPPESFCISCGENGAAPPKTSPTDLPLPRLQSPVGSVLLPLPYRPPYIYSSFFSLETPAPGADSSSTTEEEPPYLFENTLIDEESRIASRRKESAQSLSFPFISKNRYQFIELIGKGGMGRVWKVFDKQTQRVVALKRLIIAHKENQGRLERFKREAGTIAKLNHPYIVPLFDLGKDEEGPFLTMQYVEGVNLREYVENRGKLTLKEGVSLMIKVAQAIFYAHRYAVIHRDIKPENIMIDRSGLPRILDFGLARIGAESDLSLTGTFVGTRFYASPEQFKDTRRVDHRTDIYSLGATMYFMLTGELPRVVRPDRVPPEVLSVLLKALEEKVENRYFSAERMVEDLERIQNPNGSPLDNATGATETTTSPSKKIIKGLCECGHTNDAGVEFCEFCGKSLFRKCPGCRRTVSVNVKNCGYCGVDLAKREESLKLFEEAKILREEYQLDKAREKAEKALEIENLPALRNFITHIEGIIVHFERSLRQGDEALAEDKFTVALQHYHTALKIIPSSEEAQKKIELAKKKLYEDYLRKAQEALEKGNLYSAKKWCVKAQEIHETEELVEILHFVRDEIVKQKELELAESLKQLGEDEVEGEELVLEREEEDEEGSTVGRELVELVRQFNKKKHKQKERVEKSRKMNRIIQVLSETFFFVLFWFILSFLLVLVILLVLSFMGKLP